MVFFAPSFINLASLLRVICLSIGILKNLIQDSAITCCFHFFRYPHEQIEQGLRKVGAGAKNGASRESRIDHRKLFHGRDVGDFSPGITARIEYILMQGFLSRKQIYFLFR